MREKSNYVLSRGQHPRDSCFNSSSLERANFQDFVRIIVINVINSSFQILLIARLEC